MLAPPFVFCPHSPAHERTHICAYVQAAFDHNCDTARREGGSPQWGLRMVVKVNEADGSVWKENK